MRFQCTEKNIKDTIDGVFTTMVEDDVKTVPDAWGQRAVANGWGIDLDGNVPPGDRKPGSHRVTPDKVTVKA